MNKEKEIRVLGIESSCDETAAAVVVNGRDVQFKCYFLADRPAYTVWRRCAGDRVQKTYRENQPGDRGRHLTDAEMTLDDMDAIACDLRAGA